MCIRQIWTYRECGCYYNHVIACHPSFESPTATPKRHRSDQSAFSSTSESSPTPSDGSAFSLVSAPYLIRSCSVRQIVHRHFLDPICDECLLEELGLSPAFGPILGGRDQEAADEHEGQDWLLESSIEINIEHEGEHDEVDADIADEDRDCDADDEGEVRGRSYRRRGIDLRRQDIDEKGMEVMRVGAERYSQIPATKLQAASTNRASSWEQHLLSDLKDRNSRRLGIIREEARHGEEVNARITSSTLSSPHTNSAMHSRNWRSYELHPLKIASSEFDDDHDLTARRQPTTPLGHIHNTSVDTTCTDSTNCTAIQDSPSDPTSPRPSSSDNSRPPAFGTISAHPLNTHLTPSTPLRPTLTIRTSSLATPPPLAHSNPPLHQSPTSSFTCVHEVWKFIGCGCPGPRIIKSCVCSPNTHNNTDSQHSLSSANLADQALAYCSATPPLVRTRYFFNAVCQRCTDEDSLFEELEHAEQTRPRPASPVKARVARLKSEEVCEPGRHDDCMPPMQDGGW